MTGATGKNILLVGDGGVLGQSPGGRLRLLEDFVTAEVRPQSPRVFAATAVESPNLPRNSKKPPCKFSTKAMAVFDSRTDYRFRSVQGGTREIPAIIVMRGGCRRMSAE